MSMDGSGPLVPARSRTVGNVLVALQLALMAALAVLAAPEYLRGRAPALGWLLAAASVALGAWALTANRPGNFNVRPLPRAGGRLVTEGPYRWIRHPMYSAVGLGAAAAAVADASAWSWALAAALAAVLVLKASLEEQWMAERHPGYAAYRAGTSRFVPWGF